MTYNQLKEGNELQKEICDLESYLESINHYKHKECEFKLQINSLKIQIVEEFMPLPADDFFDLYKRKIQNKINKLQKQLDEL